ncbi:WcaF family extracellular polysaccharide biosynthesis acetyltransferase [Endozoicomonas sp. Mp262]|uniref:WcaF family extracellular polysaccharide biosynthesis acetyltransferase n=1 Tax=Endozoicomonas sp. Mp262 TaxID=2919499 RepID=UPI0021DB2EDF
MNAVNLSSYNNSWYQPAGKLKILLWIITSFAFFEHSLPIPNRIKVSLLRLFGANIGKGVVIKPGCKVKYPWFLTISNFVWLGEQCWIDNLAQVTIEDHCCISQGAYLLTGNHDFSKSTFDLIIKPIHIKQGSWVGAKATVCPGVTLNEHSILSVGSVATKDLEASGIYQGNPAILKRQRTISC